MQEINAERDKLKEELQEHEQYFRTKKKEEERAQCNSCVGKCFSFADCIVNRAPYTDIAAIKVLSISELFNEPRATCLVLYKNYKGMRYEVLDLWSRAIITKMYNPFACKIIHHLTEISLVEFNSLRDDIIDHFVKL